MATDPTLRMRDIQPHDRPSTHTPNLYRRATNIMAKRLRITRRAVLRRIAKGEPIPQDIIAAAIGSVILEKKGRR